MHSDNGPALNDFNAQQVKNISPVYFILGTESGPTKNLNSVRTWARHFENGILEPYGMYCNHDYSGYHWYFCIHQQKCAYFTDGTALSQALSVDYSMVATIFVPLWDLFHVFVIVQGSVWAALMSTVFSPFSNLARTFIFLRSWTCSIMILPHWICT